MPGAAATGVGHYVAQRAHNTPELAAGSVRVLLLRLLLSAAHRHDAERRLAAATPRAGRRNRRHRRGLAADQWRHTTVPAGKHRATSPPRRLPLSLSLSLTWHQAGDTLAMQEPSLACYLTRPGSVGSSRAALVLSALARRMADNLLTHYRAGRMRLSGLPCY